MRSPDPDPFADSFAGLVRARAVTVATKLGVFEALADGAATAEELAGRAGLDPLGAEVLLTALAGMDYLELCDGRFGLRPAVERLLTSGSPESIATFIGGQSDLHWQVLDGLEAAVREGRPYAMHEQRRDPEQWAAYMRGLFEISRAEHEWNASLAPVERPRELVDVAGGHGGFSMAMCRRHEGLRATVLDLPPAAAAGRPIVEEHGMGERVSFREGDVFELGLGEGVDVVSAFNLIHHLPEERNRELCRMAHGALRPGGCLLVGDTERAVPGTPEGRHAALSSLLFYAWSHGRNFSRDEVASWLDEAGFTQVEVHRNERSPWRIVVTGRMPA